MFCNKEAWLLFYYYTFYTFDHTFIWKPNKFLYSGGVMTDCWFLHSWHHFSRGFFFCMKLFQNLSIAHCLLGCRMSSWGPSSWSFSHVLVLLKTFSCCSFSSTGFTALSMWPWPPHGTLASPKVTSLFLQHSTESHKPHFKSNIAWLTSLMEVTFLQGKTVSASTRNLSFWSLWVIVHASDCSLCITNYFTGVLPCVMYL